MNHAEQYLLLLAIRVCFGRRFWRYIFDMAKELIVSVNGREKKIAIIENEQVTEFYIERGEENQGIVGNIYKGRVMRVLPGMQSAFVDIGLERDAFLYVSDFFDEEEEFERIVMDKSKKGDTAEAERAARERIQQGRLEREQQIEATHERAEPLAEAEATTGDADTADTDTRTSAASSRSKRGPVEAQPGAQAETAEESGRKRGRRGRRRGKGDAEVTADQANDADRISSLLPDEDVETPFATAGSDFQRVVDEDERAAVEDGAMFKDARLQERIFNQIHAVEFDMDETPPAEVGSLLDTANNHYDASFQRIDDSDITSDRGSSRGAQMLEPVEAHVSTFIDDLEPETVDAKSFERVSDDDGVDETDTESPKSGSARKRSGESDDEATTTSRTRTSRRKPAAKSATKKAVTPKGKPATKKPATKTGSKSKKGNPTTGSTGDEGELDIAVLEGEANRAIRADIIATDAVDSEHIEAGSTDTDNFEDGEAKLTSTPTRGEFATRRGGRRRRRKPTDTNVEEEPTNGKDEDAVVEEEVVVEPTPVEAVPEKPIPAKREPRERRERPSTQRSSGSGRGRGGRDTRQQPTITDLLREGQEILVQIAKEPIAKKGARITSHIALPGRFLVYMPTVEHLGVSRKIESDAERLRLRKLMQSIRAEENVPSGGFIVRTAGVGVSEDALREDARYLVRTWLDIRKSAEKAKAPSMAHQDLDLVQRILRDQMSEDFTAIRVDSEEEYLRIVEFVNRVQPRMVKRVKLHTRDEPILEAYGVQAEVDKAIKPRVWLRSGGYLVINQTEALVAIDVNTGKFVGRGGSRLEDTITRTNLEAVDEIVRQIRLRDLGGIIVLDLIDMEDRRNRNRVMQALQEALQGDKSPTKVLSFNDFGLVIMTRKRVKQSLERTLCAPCPYCTGAGLVKSPQTVSYEILEEARVLGRKMKDNSVKQTTLRVNPEVAKALRSTERDVLNEIEDYLGAIDITSDTRVHQEQFDFAFI
jgi:ribonuclease G